MEKKFKHLEFIQAIITRMANNSFMLKGWSVVLVSALFALSAKDRSLYFIYLAYFPAIAFWILDGYFLWQERLFRALYDGVRVKEEEAIDFSMNITPYLGKIDSWRKVMFSDTLKIFHGAIIGTIILVMLLSIYF